jgi:hypothetical protein
MLDRKTETPMEQEHLGEEGPRPNRTSDLLRDFAATLTGERVSIAAIVDALGDRGLGVLIAIFALPNVLPSTVPFGNVGTGIPVVLFAFHLALGVRHLVLPGFIGNRTLSTRSVKLFAPRVASLLSWFERLLSPRLPWVTQAGPERVVGVVCIILSVISATPIPFAHNLPAIGMVLIGMGLIERDGAAILAGSFIGLLGVTLLGLVLFGLAHGLEMLTGWL